VLREPLAIPLRDARAPLVLALDIGTSGLRAFVFDVRARPIDRCIAVADRPVRTSRDGEASVDAEERVRAACGAIDDVLAKAGRRAAEIVAVTASTFWHSLVGVDARGRPTTRVLTWADTRARGAAAALRRELDERATHARTGCVLHASYLPAKLRWLREHEPDAYRRTTRWMSLGEYLYLRILGEPRAGHGMASATGLYEQGAKRWDRELLSHLVVGEESLSPISDAPLVGLRPSFAARWPALRRAQWVPAIGDGACSNVGAGAVGRATAALFLGTSGAMRVIYPTDDAPVVAGGWCYRLDASRVVAGGALSNGGNVLGWISRAFPQVNVVRASRRAAADGGLVALPLLAGDRSPTWNDAARAAIVGIGLGTSAEDIAGAMIQGIAFRVARLWEVVSAAMPGIDRVVATGGTLLALPWLMQLFADAIDRPLLMSASGEGSARGATLAALERVGAIPDITSVRSPLGRTFRPREHVHARLRAGMERQRLLEEALVPLMS